MLFEYLDILMNPPKNMTEQEVNELIGKKVRQVVKDIYNKGYREGYGKAYVTAYAKRMKNGSAI